MEEQQLNDEEKLAEEHRRRVRLIDQLQHNEAFQLWRDIVAKPQLEAIEVYLKESDSMSEAVLRGTIKNYFTMKFLFEDVFSQARAQIELDSIEVAEPS